MSKTQLQKLRDAGAAAYEAALEVTEKTTDPDPASLDKILDFYIDNSGIMLANLDVLIGKADEP